MIASLIHTGIGITDKNGVTSYWVYYKDGMKNKQSCAEDTTGSFAKAVFLGSLNGRTFEQVKKEIVDPIEANWKWSQYNCFKHNCNTFTHTVAELLGVAKNYPDKVMLIKGCVKT